jgi:hypothetical protein
MTAMGYLRPKRFTAKPRTSRASGHEPHAHEAPKGGAHHRGPKVQALGDALIPPQGEGHHVVPGDRLGGGLDAGGDLLFLAGLQEVYLVGLKLHLPARGFKGAEGEVLGGGAPLVLHQKLQRVLPPSRDLTGKPPLLGGEADLGAARDLEGEAQLGLGLPGHRPDGDGVGVGLGFLGQGDLHVQVLALPGLDGQARHLLRTEGGGEGDLESLGGLVFQGNQEVPVRLVPQGHPVAEGAGGGAFEDGKLGLQGEALGQALAHHQAYGEVRGLPQALGPYQEAVGAGPHLLRGLELQGEGGLPVGGQVDRPHQPATPHEAGLPARGNLGQGEADHPGGKPVVLHHEGQAHALPGLDPHLGIGGAQGEAPEALGQCHTKSEKRYREEFSHHTLASSIKAREQG